MRFRTPNTPPPYLNRRDQKRMLSMVLVLCVIVVAIRFAGKPSSWYWLTGRPNEAQNSEETGNRVTEKDIDWKIRLEGDRGLKPGEFIAKSEESTNSTNSEPENSEHKNLEQTELPSDPTSAGNTEFQVKINPKILGMVQDNTIGVRRSETEIYYKILAKARKIPLSYLERASRNDVSFLVLMAESEHFRGQLLTIDGRLKRLVKFPASKNSQEIEELYEAWIFTPDSGKNPYRIICSSIPDGIPEGEDINESVRVRATGYFFKRYGYAAQHGLHIAPLLIAKKIRWFQSRTAEAENDGLIPYLVGFVVLVGSSIAITLWRFTASDAKFQQSHLKRLTEAPKEAIAALDDVEVTDMNQMFRNLAEQMESDDLKRQNHRSPDVDEPSSDEPEEPSTESNADDDATDSYED